MLRLRSVVALATALMGCSAGSEPEAVSDEMAVTPMGASHEVAARALAQPWVDSAWAEGVVVGLVHDGRTEAYGVGRRDGESTAAPDADTVFEIGSFSKVLTSLLLAEAVTRGEVTLDQPIQELVPREIEAPAREGQEITLRHLSTHASGLPRLPPMPNVDMVDPYVSYAAPQLFADLQGATLATTPGTSYAYSNFGAGLLGELLANKASTTYGALLANRITKPLGLERTSLSYPASNIAQGHSDDGVPVPAWNFKALAGAGAVRSSANDLMRFAGAVLDPPAGPAGDAMRLARTEQADLANPAGGPSARQKMGLGWHFNGPTFLWHNGQTAGCHSFVGVDLARRQAVVVLANTGVSQIDALGISLVQLLRGETPAPPPLAPVVPVPAETLRSYEGVYELAPTFHITVTNEGGRTYVQATGQPRFRIYPTSTSRFELHAVTAAVEFVTSPEGVVTSLVLHQNGAKVARKVQ